MALTVEILTSKYGRVIPDQNHHIVPIGFIITGAVSGNPTYEKSIDGTNWYPMNPDTDYNKNLDGFVNQWTVWHANYIFYIREIGYEGDVWNSGDYNLELDLWSQGLHPFGDTPKIVTNSIAVGVSQAISIQTVKPNSTVRIYTSDVVDGQESFSLYPEGYLPEIIGTSDTNGVFTSILSNTRKGQKIVASAQSAYEQESFCVNTIYVGGGTEKLKQLDVIISFGALEGVGRKINISVIGGTGNYQYSLLNNNQDWKGIAISPVLAFGKQSIIVKDTRSGSIFSKSVEILGGGNQTNVNIGLKSQFNSSINNGVWEYGMFLGTGTIFAPLDTFGYSDCPDYPAITSSCKQGWYSTAITAPISPTLQGFPIIANGGDEAFPTVGNYVLLHPAGNNEAQASAVARYTFVQNGIFNTTTAKAKKPTPSSNPYQTPAGSTYIRVIVKHNTLVIWSKVLKNQGQEVDIPINNLSVEIGDVIDIIADTAQEHDDYSPDFDHLHVAFEGVLSTNSASSAGTAPNIPVLVAGTGASNSNILQGTNIIVRTNPDPEWVVVYKEGYFQTIIKTKSGVTNDYAFIGGQVGNYTVKTISNGIFNAGADVAFIVSPSSVVAVTTPTVSRATASTGESATIISPSGGEKIVVYKGGTEIERINISNVSNVSTEYLFSSAGTYTFKVFKSNSYSSASSSVVVSSPSVVCANITDGLAIGNFNYTGGSASLVAEAINSKLVIVQQGDNGVKLIRNSNFLNVYEVISDFKGHQSCFFGITESPYGALSIDDIGIVTGYSWSVTTDGYNTPILIPNTDAPKTSRRFAARTNCENKPVKFYISESNLDSSVIATTLYSNDGIVKLTPANELSDTGTEHYYKIFELASGTYYLYVMVEGTNTPVKKTIVTLS